MTFRLRPDVRSILLLLPLLAACAVAWSKPPPASRAEQVRHETPVQVQYVPLQRSQQAPRPPVETLSDAVRRIERATRGQVLSAERLQFDGRDVHRVKVLDGRGRVRVYTDDPMARPALRTRRDDGSAPNL